LAWLFDWWDTVAETTFLGFGITVVGMALVFFTLGLVIVAMVLLTRLPWLRNREPASSPMPARPEPVESAKVAPVSQDELATVAAIAVVMLRRRQSCPVRQRTEPRRSTWKTYGRAHQLGL
jgi:Na+-transporting methylmalonyl-CoA/oxaloacetate decarboxylase gamma subunit